jgi:hypothetical protein
VPNTDELLRDAQNLRNRGQSLGPPDLPLPMNPSTGNMPPAANLPPP